MKQHSMYFFSLLLYDDSSIIHNSLGLRKIFITINKQKRMKANSLEIKFGLMFDLREE